MQGKPQLTIDVISDVVCPWCYIGKRRLEDALAQVNDVDVTVRWRPFFLNPWIPREGIDRDAYLTAKFGSVEQYKGIAGRVRDAAASEGLHYNSDQISRQPNTTDCHRLILWAEQIGQSAAMKQKLMSLYFTEGANLTDREVLAQAAADCGLDAQDVRARLATDEDVDEISAAAESAANAGVSGVPTFILAGKYGISGAQPAEQLVQAIRQVAAMNGEEVAQG
jgi:predicted DsbA family dithiol-disulfide isomerase